MKYKIYVSDRQLECKKGTCDWVEGTGNEQKMVESHNTLKECFDSMSDWGSRWVMYPSAFIECEEDGEVWESTAAVTKCKCCGREDWENLESGNKLHNGKLVSIEEAIELGI
jgi:hypothetical protein